MDIKNLVPIDFSRSVTPFVAGDTYWNDYLNIESVMSKMEARNFNNQNFANFDTYFIISYADRPNTGKQPVGDDVVIDRTLNDGSEACAKSAGGDYCELWDLLGDSNCIALWKPSHDYMVKAFQESELKKSAKESHYDRAHHIALQVEELGNVPKLDFVINVNNELSDVADTDVADIKPMRTNERIRQLEDAFNEITRVSDYQDCYDIAVDQLDLSTITDIRPIFTQAMADNNELPPIDVLVQMRRDYSLDYEFYNVIVRHAIGGKAWVKCDKYGDDIINWGRVTFRPIITDADKLRAAIGEYVNEPFMEALTADGIIDDLLASDKFTITLNKG